MISLGIFLFQLIDYFIILLAIIFPNFLVFVLEKFLTLDHLIHNYQMKILFIIRYFYFHPFNYNFLFFIWINLNLDLFYNS